MAFENEAAVKKMCELYDLDGKTIESNNIARFVSATVRNGTESNINIVGEQSFILDSLTIQRIIKVIQQPVIFSLSEILSRRWGSFNKNDHMNRRFYQWDTENFPLLPRAVMQTEELVKIEDRAIRALNDITMIYSSELLNDIATLRNSLRATFGGSEKKSINEFNRFIGRWIVRCLIRKYFDIKDEVTIDRCKEQLMHSLEFVIENSCVEPGVIYEVNPKLIGQGIFESGNTCTSSHQIELVDSGTSTWDPKIKEGIYIDDPLFRDIRGQWVMEWNTNVHIIGYKAEKSGMSSRMWVFDLGDIIGFCNFYSKNHKGGMKEELSLLYLGSLGNCDEWVQMKNKVDEGQGLPSDLRAQFISHIGTLFYCNSDWNWYIKKQFENNPADSNYDMKLNTTCGCRVVPSEMKALVGIGVVCITCYPDNCSECDILIREHHTPTHQACSKGRVLCYDCAIKDDDLLAGNCILCGNPVFKNEHTENSLAHQDDICLKCMEYWMECSYCGNTFRGHEMCNCETGLVNLLPKPGEGELITASDIFYSMPQRRARQGHHHCVKCCGNLENSLVNMFLGEFHEANKQDLREDLPKPEEDEEE